MSLLNSRFGIPKPKLICPPPDEEQSFACQSPPCSSGTLLWSQPWSLPRVAVPCRTSRSYYVAWLGSLNISPRSSPCGTCRSRRSSGVEPLPKANQARLHPACSFVLIFLWTAALIDSWGAFRATMRDIPSLLIYSSISR